MEKPKEPPKLEMTINPELDANRLAAAHVAIEADTPVEVGG